jgi:membrane protein YqaA with SNARE-associated domain
MTTRRCLPSRRWYIGSARHGTTRSQAVKIIHGSRGNVSAYRRVCAQQRTLGGPGGICARVRGIARLHFAADPGLARAGCARRFFAASGINIWPIWIAGSLGAACGDWLSYWVGLKLEHSVANIWPLSRHPDLIPKGQTFIKKWGIPGILIGRFFGPLRAVVPLIAGIFEMPYWHFQLANFSSAFVWAATLLSLGDAISMIVKYLWY